MAWLYVPGMEGSNSELNESYQAQEPFVMWRGNVLPFNTLSKKWKKVAWMKRLSGLMSKPSEARNGVEKWIGFLEDSHANPIQLLESNWGKKTQETYGPILSESLGKCDQDSYSLKMFQTSLNFDLIKLSLTSINWGIMLHGVLWQLPTLAPPIKERGGSSWRFATPIVQDSWNINNLRKAGKESLAKGKWRGIDLKTSAILIPKGYTEKWPTPTTRGYAHASEGQVAALLNKVKKGDISMKEAEAMLNLSTLKNHRTFKKMFPTPTKSDAEKYRLKGESQSAKCLVSMAIKGELTNGMEDLKQSGRLNPEWVAWLMGLPIGWINSDY